MTRDSIPLCDSRPPETEPPAGLASSGARTLLQVWADGAPTAPHPNRLLWQGGSGEFGGRSIGDYMEMRAEEVRRRYLAWSFELGDTPIRGRRLRERFRLPDGSSLWPLSVFVEQSMWKQRSLEAVLKVLAFELLMDEDAPQQVEFVGADPDLHAVLAALCGRRGIVYTWRRTPARGVGVRRALWQVLPSYLQGTVSLAHYALTRLGLGRPGPADEGGTGRRVMICGQFFNFTVEAAPGGAAARVHPPRESVGRFTSQFWTRLPPVLAAAGCRVEWLHIFYPHDKVPTARAGRTLVERLNFRRGPDGRHAFADSYLSCAGIVRIVRAWLRISLESHAVGRELRRRYAGAGVERFWPLIRGDWARAFRGFGCIESLYYAECFDRALALAPHQEEGLYLMENQGWERALVRAWRKHGHGRLAGVAHSTIRFWDLRYHSDPRRYGPGVRAAFHLPDAVVVNGPAAREEYLSTTGTREPLVDCEALRYLHLVPRPPAQDSAHRSGRPLRLLVLGDFLRASTVALLAVLDSLHRHIGLTLEIWLKAHPNCPVSKSDAAFPLKVVGEPVAVLVPLTDLVLASNTTSASLDAYVSGARVIVFDDRSGVNFSPLRGIPGVPFVRDERALGEAIEAVATGDFPCERPSREFFNIDPSLRRWREYLGIRESGCEQVASAATAGGTPPAALRSHFGLDCGPSVRSGGRQSSTRRHP